MTRTSRKRRTNLDLGMCPTTDQLWKRVCQTDLSALLVRDQAFSAALAIRDGDMLVRSEVQARILANQPQAEIATKMGIQVDAIAEFEDWFFDVRDRFEMTGWIAREAIQRRPSGELRADDWGPFVRWAGFRFGPAVLESFLAAASRESLYHKKLDALWQKGSPLDIDLKLLVLAERMPFRLSTKKQMNVSFKCQEALLIAKTLPTEKLLTPLPLEMSLFSEEEIVVPNFESQDRGVTQAIEGLSTDFEIEPFPVVQKLCA